MHAACSVSAPIRSRSWLTTSTRRSVPRLGPGTDQHLDSGSGRHRGERPAPLVIGALAAHQRHLFHHDHAGLQPDALLLLRRRCRIWRRRRIADPHQHRFRGLQHQPRTFYYVALGTLAAVIRALASRAQPFRHDSASHAQNERRVIAFGIPPLRYKLAAFVISGAITGLAGALWAAGSEFVSPSDLSWVRSGDLVVMAVLGGTARVWGPVIGRRVSCCWRRCCPSWTYTGSCPSVSS